MVGRSLRGRTAISTLRPSPGTIIAGASIQPSGPGLCRTTFRSLITIVVTTPRHN